MKFTKSHLRRTVNNKIIPTGLFVYSLFLTLVFILLLHNYVTLSVNKDAKRSYFDERLFNLDLLASLSNVTSSLPIDGTA